MGDNEFLLKTAGTLCCSVGIITTILIILILSLRRKNDMEP